MGFADFLFGSKGTPASAQAVTLPQFSFDEPSRRASSNFLVEQLQAVGRGELPQFFQNQVPLLRRGLDRGLRQTFFGQPGRRGEGLVSQAASLGALTGAGPRATTANVNKQFQNFSNQAQAIDEFIAQQGVNQASQVALNFPNLINQQRQGPSAQVVTLPGQAGSQGFLSQALGTAVGSAIGGATGNPFSALSGLFSGGGGGAALSSQITPTATEFANQQSLLPQFRNAQQSFSQF
jgi:hypothetical protein